MATSEVNAMGIRKVKFLPAQSYNDQPIDPTQLVQCNLDVRSHSKEGDVFYAFSVETRLNSLHTPFYHTTIYPLKGEAAIEAYEQYCSGS